jgi:hypothetical protein
MREIIVSSRELGEILNLTERRIHQLAKEKLIPRNVRGQYDLALSVQAYVRYLKSQIPASYGGALAGQKR